MAGGRILDGHQGARRTQLLPTPQQHLLRAISWFHDNYFKYLGLNWLKGSAFTKGRVWSLGAKNSPLSNNIPLATGLGSDIKPLQKP